VLLVSDGDVRVRPSFLRQTAAELADPAVGLVSNPFRGVGAGSIGSAVEALHFNGFVFGGTAAVSRVAGRPCVVGKSILVRRTVLDWIGGLDAVKDFLAEDYLLGSIVDQAGFRVALSRHVIDSISSGKSLRQFWDRQVRWARMRRRLGGPAYALEALASPLPWALLLLGSRYAGVAAAIIAGKLLLDATVLRRLRASFSLAGLLLKDLLFFGVFWAGLASNRTRWRGKDVRIGVRTLLNAG
jgi:ceramide glucosyltransferase